MEAPLWERIKRYFAESPIEPILSPIPSRLMMLGAITAVGHLVYYLAWRYLEPSLYESLPLRLLMACTGVVFMIPAFHNHPDSFVSKTLFVLLVFLQVPLFFFFMYLMNGAHRGWLASAALIIVALYSLTDWRVATVQLVLAFPLAVGAWLVCKPVGQLYPVTATDLMVFSFSVGSGMALAIFSASTRQIRLKHSNEVMGILAHELRTPLSANGLLAETILAQSERVEQADVRKKLQTLAARMQVLTDAMNHHIDLQIINAKMLQMPKFQDRIRASELVHSTVEQYPFRSKTHRDCVRIAIEEDFAFIGSLMYFGKVLDNLIANAIKSLQVAGSDFHPGVLFLTVSRKERKGVISVADRGMGIDAAQISHLFKPYYSTDRQASHGLGLFFCRRVVESAGGKITVRSPPLLGAKFEIWLPALNESQSPQRSLRSSLGNSFKGKEETTRPLPLDVSM